MAELVTGEAVALDLRVAALPTRVVAAAVDLAAQALLGIGLGLAFALAASGVSDAVAAALGVVLTVVVLAGYPVAFETLWRGRTPGKALMGLRVVRDDGGPVGFRQALPRGLAAAFLEKPGVTLFVLPVALILLHPDGKRAGDLLAGTVVVRERGAPARAAMPPEVPVPLRAWAATLELSRLSDPLAASVRQFLLREGELTPAARDQLGARLVASVREATAPPPPEGTPGWAYLTAVLAERRRRATLRLAPSPPDRVQAVAPPAAREEPTGGFALPS